MAMIELSRFCPVCNWSFQRFTKIVKESAKDNHSREASANLNTDGSAGNHGGEGIGLQTQNSCGGDPLGTWMEWRSLCRAGALVRGQFDFSYIFDGVSDGFVNFGADASATGFPGFLANK